MQISDEGMRLIKSFEGYHDRLPDGRCKAYQRQYKGKLDIPTIGYGCTEGVQMGMIWTEEEALAALRREIATFEAAVSKLVTVSINQNEFDAMVSLSYNIGKEGFGRSSVLRRLNNGDRVGAANAFDMWNKVGKYVVNGLVARRAREKALFLKPVAAPQLPAMPQTVSESQPVSKPAIAVGAAAVATAAPAVIPVPAVPDVITQSVSQLEAWKALGETAWTLKSFAVAQPLLAGALSVSLAAVMFWPKSKS